MFAITNITNREIKMNGSFRIQYNMTYYYIHCTCIAALNCMPGNG